MMLSPYLVPGLAASRNAVTVDASTGDLYLHDVRGAAKSTGSGSFWKKPAPARNACGKK
jgi:hypothetical protein